MFCNRSDTNLRNTTVPHLWCYTNRTLLLYICDLLYRVLYRPHGCTHQNYSLSTQMGIPVPFLNNSEITNIYCCIQYEKNNKVSNLDLLDSNPTQMRMASWPASVELQTVFSFHTPMCCVFANKKPPEHFRWLEVRNNYQELWAYSIYSATLQPLGWGWRHQKTKHRMDAKSIRCRNLYRLYFMTHSAIILIKGFDTPPMEHPPATVI